VREVLPNFGWVVPGRLAAMARPRPGSAPLLLAAGVRAVLCLTEEPPLPELAEAGISVQHEPVRDFAAPSVAALRRCVEFLRSSISAGAPAAVHCFAGYGRTGTVVAAYLIATGLPAEEAIAEVRATRPGSIETWEQEEAILRFAEAKGA
jgi:atypical dual specificity phosphatase